MLEQNFVDDSVARLEKISTIVVSLLYAANQEDVFHVFFLLLFSLFQILAYSLMNIFCSRNVVI